MRFGNCSRRRGFEAAATRPLPGFSSLRAPTMRWSIPVARRCSPRRGRRPSPYIRRRVTTFRSTTVHGWRNRWPAGWPRVRVPASRHRQVRHCLRGQRVRATTVSAHHAQKERAALEAGAARQSCRSQEEGSAAARRVASHSRVAALRQRHGSPRPRHGWPSSNCCARFTMPSQWRASLARCDHPPMRRDACSSPRPASAPGAVPAAPGRRIRVARAAARAWTRACGTGRD